MNPIPEELRDLIDEYLGGEMEAPRFDRLQTWLRDDPWARAYFVRYGQMQSQLYIDMRADRAADRALSRIWELAGEGSPEDSVAAEIAALQAEADSPAGDSAPLAPPAGKSPVLGFLGDLGRQGWGFVSGHGVLFSSLVVLVVVAALVTLAVRNNSLGRQNATAKSEIADLKSQISDSPFLAEEGQGPGADSATPRFGNFPPPAFRSPLPASSIARLSRSYDCVWSAADKPLNDGARLQVGQQLQLRSGLAEIRFDCGARVILQGPASLLLESARSASMSEGKVTVRAEKAEAKGFAIRTPSMKTIDLGTEFGLEASPSGIEQVHVFQGKVEVEASSVKGPSTAPQQLLEKQGIEVNPKTQGVKLVANNGDRFARSLDDAQKNQHVVAYWRFEDHPVGTLVPDSKQGNDPVRGSLDSSLNGNDLYAWHESTQPTFSADVPAPFVPQSGTANAASLDNSQRPAGLTRDLFTMSDWSRPSPVDLRMITPAAWTIEASVKPVKLRGGAQVFLVRDGISVSFTDPALPPLAFEITPQNRFQILFCDIDQRAHVATADSFDIEENHWFHLAATSDGKNLKLYIDALDGNGYLLRAVAKLPATGSTALARGSWPNNPRSTSGYPYIWSVGRGYYNGQVGRWFQGLIDEVRICDVALAPKNFLFATPSSLEGRGQDEIIVPRTLVHIPRKREEIEKGYLRWKCWSESIRKDPELVGYYLFEPELPPPASREREERRGTAGEGGLKMNTSGDASRAVTRAVDSSLPGGGTMGHGKAALLLRNLASAGAASRGEIHGALPCEGRWPGKQALLFSARDDHVRLDVPGEFRALTLAAWVSPGGLDNEFNGLLLSDGWFEHIGQCHWQLTQSRRMDFGVCLGPSVDTVYYSKPLLETDGFGRWRHLAVVYDSAAKQIAFYVDGQPIGMSSIAVAMPLVLGPCEIGNWAPRKDLVVPVRNFQGRIDELLIFRRGLTAAEVKAMYDKGKP